MGADRSNALPLVFATVLALLVAGCGGTAEGHQDLAAGSTAVADSPSPVGSGEPTEAGPGAEVPTTPRPEGTGPEKPRPRSRAQVSVAIAGPGIGKGDEPEISAESPTGCLRVVLSDAFAEDARVDGVSVGPAGVFGRDDAPCHEQDKAPLCPGFVFLAAEQGSACFVGLRWSPESGQPEGLLSLGFSATCHSREGACAVVDPGTPVTFTSGLTLRALVFEEEEGSGDGEGEGGTSGHPDSGNPDTGEPDGGGPDDGQPDGTEPDGGQPDSGTDGDSGDSS